MGSLDSDHPPYVSGEAGRDTIPDMARPHTCRCEPVATGDIAARLGIPRNTAHKWQQRGIMPPARWTVGGADSWCWEQDILPWLRASPRRRELLGEDAES
jgi:hypothetical protein